MKKHAFTLAETLITLTIIGVVAAMTIPTLMSKYQEHQFHTAWKANFSILHNAFKMAAAENRGVTFPASSSGASEEQKQMISTFYNAMLSNLAVVETCGLDFYDTNRCDNSDSRHPDKVKYKWSGIAGPESRYTTLAGGQLNSYNFHDRAALLKNGAAIYFGQSHGGQSILVDVNNWNKGPNVLGKDVYAINIREKGNRSWYMPTITIDNAEFLPYGAAGSYCGTDHTYCEENFGVRGCSKDIGDIQANYIYQASGSGCSAKYLYE